MRFWDSSAVLPLLNVEPSSPAMEALAREDPSIAVWWATPVECVSALARQQRAGRLEERGAAQAARVLDRLASSWSEVSPGSALRSVASRLLRTHPLRAGDALQLAAALTWAEADPGGKEFVCLDDRLRSAALREGFSVLPE